MGKLKLFIGIYNSLAPSMGEEEISTVYNQSFKEYLTKIYNAKRVSLSLYYNGKLLSWIEKNHPEYISVIEELAQKQRVEILTGPYNEPMLPVIPVSDRLGQLEKQTTYLRKLFKKRFRGCWLPGQIWESALASNLSASGINYTFLEVEQLERSGINNLYEPIITEDQGKTLTIIPFHRVLSESALKAPPANIIASMRQIVNESPSERLVNLMFPGELLASSEKQEWFAGFLKLVEANSDWIDCQIPSVYLKNQSGPLKRAYINSSNYGDIKRFFKDKKDLIPDINAPSEYDSYRSILSSHPQQAYYYGRLKYVTLLINSVRGDKSRKKSARENLWKAQNLYSFWSGEMAHQSKRMGFINLIEAEKTTREKGIFNSSVIEIDYDMDGQNEFVFQGLVYNGCVHLNGGTLFELDYLPSCWNYGFNRGGRKSFIDCFLLDDFTSELYYERRNTFNGAGVYSYALKNVTRDEKQVLLKGDITVSDKEGTKTDIRMAKKYLFKRNWFVVSYTIENLSEWSREFHFGTEINLSIPGESEENLNLSFVTTRDKNDKNGQEVSNCSSILMVDGKNSTDIQLDFGEDLELWYFYEMETMTVIPRKKFSLYPKEKKEIIISLKLGRHKS